MTLTGKMRCVFLEERASFSPDAMTGMEANLRFAGPETMETRIFGRLTAWQNWIFNRPNAVGDEGALQRYGSGKRGQYSMLERVERAVFCQMIIPHKQLGRKSLI